MPEDGDRGVCGGKLVKTDCIFTCSRCGATRGYEEDYCPEILEYKVQITAFWHQNEFWHETGWYRWSGEYIKCPPPLKAR